MRAEMRNPAMFSARSDETDVRESASLALRGSQRMGQVTPYYEFVKQYAGLSQARFLEKFSDPFLYFKNLPELDQSVLFQTLQFKSLRPESEGDTPEVLLQSAGLPTELGLSGICPVRKDRGINAFSTMITLGRATNNDIVVPDRRISKFHVYFRRVQGAWALTDANSTNGTRVDGEQVPPERSATLRSGSKLELSGVVEAVFLESPELYTLVSDLADLVA